MAKIRVGINGFGRIGRLAFRRILEVGTEMEVVAINDLTSPSVLAHLLKYDSTHGTFKGTVESTEDSIIVDGKKSASTPRRCPQHSVGRRKVDVVLESTGFYTSVRSPAHWMPVQESLDLRSCGQMRRSLQRQRQHPDQGRQDHSAASCTPTVCPDGQG
jgi:glyceraldehyde-3-phosphate dehydrogenase/erythrose-4-phosphate dehydrogenase